MLYIEPTPYILGLISEVEKLLDLPDLRVEAVFITSNLTQAWDLNEEVGQYSLLPAGKIAAILQVSKRLSKEHFDLVHLAGWGHPLLLTALLLAFAKRIPVVVESDTQLPFEISTIKRVLKKLLMPWLFKLPSGLLPGGTRQARYLKHYGVPEEKIQIAQMTVDVEGLIAFSREFTRERRIAFRKQWGVGNDAVLFLYVGRMESYKGIDELLEASKRLHDQNKKCLTFFVGDGSLAEDLASISRVDSGVIFAGRLSGDQLLSAYNSANVFVLPSTFEPWGLVVNEAMAAGLPVIASLQVGCVDDLVINDSTGLVFDHGEPGSLFQAMAALHDDANGRLEMGQNGRNLISNWTLAEEARRVTRMWEWVS